MHMHFNTLQLLSLYKFYCLFSNSAKIIHFNKNFMHCQGMAFQNIGPSKIFFYINISLHSRYIITWYWQLILSIKWLHRSAWYRGSVYSWSPFQTSWIWVYLMQKGEGFTWWEMAGAGRQSENSKVLVCQGCCTSWFNTAEMQDPFCSSWYQYNLCLYA